MDREIVNYVKMLYRKGDRVMLIHMKGEERMEYGDKGTITSVDDSGQIHVSWDDKGSLALQLEHDDFVKL